MQGKIIQEVCRWNSRTGEATNNDNNGNNQFKHITNSVTDILQRNMESLSTRTRLSENGGSTQGQGLLRRMSLYVIKAYCNSSVYCKCGMIVESHHLWFYNHTKTIFWRVELLLTCTQNEKKGAWFFRGGA